MSIYYNMVNPMERKVRQMYLECSCLPGKLISDINYFFRYADREHAKKSLKLLTPEQLDTFYKLNEIYKQSSTTEEEAEDYAAQIITSLVPMKESQKLRDIRRFLEKCECPYTIGTDYRHTGAFHNFESLTAFFKNLGMKID